LVEEEDEEGKEAVGRTGAVELSVMLATLLFR
jgi:hypothetical protein